jgi:hypothetical protein
MSAAAVVDDGLESDLQAAELLARYAARAAKLPPNTTIWQEIKRVREQLAAGRALDTAPLFIEMDRLAKAIAPVTVAQLVRKQSLRVRVRRYAAYLAPIGLSFLTLLLAVYLAFQSSELHRADMALREYQGLMNERPHEKLYQAWKMFRYEQVLNVQGPPLAQLDEYQKLVEDFRRLVETRNAILRLFADSQYIYLVPQWIERRLQIGLTANNSALATVGTNGLPLQSQNPLRQDAVFALPPSPYVRGQVGEAAVAATECAVLAYPAKGKRVTLDAVKDLDSYTKSINCFMRALHISVDDYNYPLSVAIYQTRLKVNMLVTWLLPFLYGLLGACVFLMRKIVLADGVLQFYEELRLVNFLSLTLRVALGGLAGIIIGWFWVPDTTVSSAGPLSISSVPFGIAFFAGFSMETLFSLLDRLNTSVTTRKPASGLKRQAKGTRASRSIP